jgi:ATP-binding cassette subfamily B protein
VLGERGGTLSGGQRQAIAIARALLKDAPIVLLDEPATGLDSESSALVLAALDRLMEGRTVMVVSHQMESVRRVDRVLVMERGRIVDQGTHEGLAGREGVYRTLQRLQLGGKP